MRTVIVNCFDTYESRVDLVYDFFMKKNLNVTVLQSNFMHFKKKYRNDSKTDYFYIQTKSYTKNLSVKRLFSHFKFSIDAFKKIKKIEPLVMYIILPPNSLAKMAVKYKIKNPNVILIFDIIDLWPETMPIGNVKRTLPFTLWRNLRDNNLKYANHIITECDLFQNTINQFSNTFSVDTLYFSKKKINTISKPNLSSNNINLVYLGSINNIIDISKIENIIYQINQLKDVTLHIIGDGENLEKLINNVESLGATVISYGEIYDSEIKQGIFDKCHFGLNIMKPSVHVGLTMKSIDYFQYGVPIINNIPWDTKEIVDKYNVGVNIIESINPLLKLIESSDKDKMYLMRKNCIAVFQNFFSQEAFEKSLNTIYKKIMKKD